MKRIALFTRSLSRGGAEKVLSLISLSLPLEYDKTIILLDGDRIDYNYCGEIAILKANPKNNIISKGIAFISRVIEVKRIKKERMVDVTISFLDSPNIVNIFSVNKSKVILSVRNYKLTKKGFYNRITSILMSLFYNHSDSIIAVSELIKEDLIHNYGINCAKIKVIYNPYDISAIADLANEEIDVEYKSIFKNPTLINVGRLHKQKGQKHLLKIISDLKRLIPNIQLLMLGEGEEELELKNLCVKLGIDHCVHFLGFQGNPYKYISKADIFVFPSLHEGFPNALVEAMACGTPVISADCKSGPREILAPGTDIFKQTTASERAAYGVLMPVIEKNNDELINLWTSEIYALLNDTKALEVYSDLGIKRVKDFSVEKIIEQWIEVIETS